MVLSVIAGCGNSEGGSAQSNGGAADTGSARGNTADSPSEAGGGGDITELKAVLMSQGNTVGWDDVEAEINRIAGEAIGVNIDVEWIELGSWNQQINLKMSSQEEMDIIMLTPLMTFSNLYGANQLMDITDVLEDYGQDILNIDGEYLQSTAVDGRIYGIPNYYSKEGTAIIEMRTDVLEELGILEQAENIATWDDYEEILKAVKEQTEYVPMFCVGRTGYATTVAGHIDVSENDFSQAEGLESAGDPYGLVNIDPETNQVYCYYLTENFLQDAARAADFYQKGYMYQDGANSLQTAIDMYIAGSLFSSLNIANQPKIEDTIESNLQGLDMTVVEICNEPVTRSNANMWGYAVPFTSKNPEAAVEFINLLYTNEALANLFVWGIEGRDYTVNEDGTVTKTEEPQYESETFFYGNSLLAYPNDIKGVDFNDLSEEVIQNQSYSKYLGFSCETDAIANELAACYNVKLEYAPSLVCGSSSDYAADLEAFKEKLESSGIQKILDYYQEQLNQWMNHQES